MYMFENTEKANVRQVVYGAEVQTNRGSDQALLDVCGRQISCHCAGKDFARNP